MESAELQSLSQSIRLCSTVFNAVATWKDGGSRYWAGSVSMPTMPIVV